ncbi:hypothetical protein ACNVED_11885 [Legionella sp. D16C41]|uniref:hypothetical protein n=1 Tax=Legionella sp. D16C41 TaxID=3402688 RepID=UPI003AF8B52E
MLRFNKFKNYFLGITLFSVALGPIFAAPNVKKATNSAKLTINYKADSIVNLPDNQGTLLKGKVNININQFMQLSADKVLIKFFDNKSKAIHEFIIFGEGTLKDKQSISHFKNGVYNPKSKKLMAEKIWR